MKNSFSLSSVWALILFLQSSCSSGVRDLDLINKQFQITYNVDSTRGLDSTNLAIFQNSKAIYAFSEGGKGTSHMQTGMLSKDHLFTWSLKKDSLLIDQTTYRIQKEGQRLVLRSDSAKIMMSQQQ
ncbi:hypothetical protein ACFQ4C_20605 [Larkinella insperata]|uniref:Lipocalin-like domain-containing protein n=1 Tax=Larkinella insperata TaxID=332158 RepID=A0ABW3QNJ1_9BACT